jgi:hypothetical protein
VGGVWKVCPYTEGSDEEITFTGFNGRIVCPDPKEACFEGAVHSVSTVLPFIAYPQYYPS